MLFATRSSATYTGVDWTPVSAISLSRFPVSSVFPATPNQAAGEPARCETLPGGGSDQATFLI
jgi:hypothetical protein